MTYYKIHKFLKISIFILFLFVGVKNVFAQIDEGIGSIDKSVYMNTVTDGRGQCSLFYGDETTQLSGSSSSCNTIFGRDAFAFPKYQFVSITRELTYNFSECKSDNTKAYTQRDKRTITCMLPCAIDVPDNFTKLGSFENCEQHAIGLGYSASDFACACPSVIDPVTKNNLYVNPDITPVSCPSNASADQNGVCQCDSSYVKNTLGECSFDGDGDGIADEDEDPQACENIPSLVADQLGWYKIGTYSVEQCTPTFQNDSENDGSRYYFSRTDPYKCNGYCLGYQNRCSIEEVYSVIYGGCTNPNKDVDCTHVDQNTRTLTYNGKCQKEYLCDDGFTAYQSEVIECPTDENGTVSPFDEKNQSITAKTELQNMVDALTQYGAATTVKQDELIKHTKVTNTKLDTINETLTSTNNKLDGITKAVNKNGDKTLDALNNIAKSLGGTSTTTVSGSGDTPGEDENGVDTSSFDGAMTTLDGIFGEVGIFADNIKGDVLATKEAYENTKSLVEKGITVMPNATVISCPETFNIKGSSYTVDRCADIAPYSNLLYSIFYLIGLTSVSFISIGLFFRGGN